jgi:hypothetical protein
MATAALREAIENGLVSGDWPGDFPKHVWYKDGPVVYEARLTNKEQGTYHAYPLNGPEEWPRGMNEE